MSNLVIWKKELEGFRFLPNLNQGMSHAYWILNPNSQSIFFPWLPQGGVGIHRPPHHHHHHQKCNPECLSPIPVYTVPFTNVSSFKLQNSALQQCGERTRTVDRHNLLRFLELVPKCWKIYKIIKITTKLSKVSSFNLLPFSNFSSFLAWISNASSNLLVQLSEIIPESP